MDRLLFELRLAIRRLKSRPGFSLTAILSLGFGIGATTVFFSLLNSTLLKPLPVEQPEKLFSLVDPRFGAPVVSNPNIRDMRDRCGTFFSHLMAYRIVPVNASLGQGANTRMWGYQVSGNYFEGLGVKAARGRLFTMEDDRKKGAHPVAVISDLAWKRRFAADPAAIGKVIKLNGHPFTVIGVAPEGFYGTERFYAPEIFTTIAMIEQVELGGSGYDNDRDSQNTFTIGRILPGLSQAQAQAGLDGVTAQLAREFPKENEGFKLKLTEPGWGGDFLRGAVVGFNVILMAVAGALLLVVCVNLASLLLAQASERRKETAVRMAIGAGRGQLIRQLLLESVVLAVIGGGLGLLIASWSVDVISTFKPPVDFSIQTEVKLDSRVFAFSAFVTLLASLIFGLMPAWQSTQTDLAAAMKNDVSDSRKRRWPLRDLLVGAQIALSVVLLVCSGLMLKSLNNAMSVNLGFEPQGAASLGFDLASQGYSKERGVQFQTELLRRLRQMPSIQSAASASALPLDLNFSNSSVWETGQPEPPASKMTTAQVFWVTPDFLRTMKTKLIYGREFEETDTKDRPRVIIINQEFARKILHLSRPELALGKRVETNGKTHEVIGVAEDGKYFGLSEAPRPVMFLSAIQSYLAYTRVVWRTGNGLSPQESVNQVRKLVLEMDSEMPIFDSETLEQHMNLPMLPARFAAGAMSAFGLVTMLLAAIGIYGVTAFAVARRTREIGIRMAIGAAPAQIAGLILNRATLLVGISAAIGAVLALLASGLLTPILIGVDPRDWSSHSIGVLMMAAIAILACLIPARRAAALDPSQSLRRD
jgi:predicted permease